MEVMTNGLDALAYIYNMFRTGQTKYELFAGFDSNELRPIAEVDTVEDAELEVEQAKADFGFRVFELRDTSTGEVVNKF